jgi:hypothetical protein
MNEGHERERGHEPQGDPARREEEPHPGPGQGVDQGHHPPSGEGAPASPGGLGQAPGGGGQQQAPPAGPGEGGHGAPGAESGHGAPAPPHTGAPVAEPAPGTPQPAQGTAPTQSPPPAAQQQQGTAPPGHQPAPAPGQEQAGGPGQGTAQHATPSGPSAGDPGEGGLLGRDSSESFGRRWDDIQAGFVDEPRHAVEQADRLVIEITEQITRTFSLERERLEGEWSRGGEVSTDDMRLALQRYRSLFQRLLSL